MPNIDWDLAVTIAAGILIATVVIVCAVFGWLAISDD